MKPNTLLIAVLLLAVLGGAVWYTRENPPEDEDAAPKIVDLEADDIREVTVRQAGEEPVTVVRGEDDEWQFGGDLTIAADDGSVDTMVASLAGLNADRVVSEGVVDWSPYELDEPSLSVSYALEDGGGELQFGRATPTGSGVFARLLGDPRLFTVYSYNKTGFEKSPFDLRDKRLLRLDEESITSVTVEAGGRVLEFSQSDSDWSIERPHKLRADEFTVGDLVRAIRTAEMTEVLHESDEPDSTYSFATPLATVTVEDGGGRHELVVAADGDSHYARSSAQPGVYSVSSTLATSFDKPVDDFRERKLFQFGFTDPENLEIRDRDRLLEIARRDGVWLLASDGDRELENADVQTLLDRVRSLSATGFPSERAADRGRYGLDAPSIEVTVRGVPDDSSSETVVISDPANRPTYAARTDEDSTYEIEQSVVNNIVRSLDDLLAPPEEDEGESSGEDDESGDGPA